MTHPRNARRGNDAPIPPGKITAVDAITAIQPVAAVETDAAEHANGKLEAYPTPFALAVDGVRLDESAVRRSPALTYVLMNASLLERRNVSREELLHAFRKRMRQRSIGQLTRRDYVLHYLNQHPP